LRDDIHVSPRFVPATVAELARIGLLAEMPGETLTKLATRMERRQLAPTAPRSISDPSDDGSHDEEEG